jgi:hypothetical protein
MNDKFIKTPRCNKSGIRINNSPPINEQEQFYNKIV